MSCVVEFVNISFIRKVLAKGYVYVISGRDFIFELAASVQCTAVNYVHQLNICLYLRSFLILVICYCWD